MRQWKQHKQPWVVGEHQMQPLHSLCTGAGSGTMPLCPLCHAGAGAAPIQFVPARVMGEQGAEAAGRAAGVLRQDWTAWKQAGVPVPPPKSRAYWHQNYGQWSVSNDSLPMSIAAPRISTHTAKLGRVWFKTMKIL